ncbi:MAG TPA: hypothetical protein VKY59_05715 [Spirillospora sp.]|jgi:hypothetical protein|nr:hypothetical protein [Spirillospora sp.]
MPVEFAWDNDEKTVVRVVATMPWNWNDFHKAMRRASFLLDTVQHDVDLLIDLRQSVKLPAGALGHIRSLGAAIHPNNPDRAAILGLDKSIAGPLGGDEGSYSDGTRLLRFVDTDEEARAILEQWQAGE